MIAMIGKDMIIDVVCAAVRAKVTDIVLNDRMIGWDGVIHAFGRNFEVSIVEIEDLE